MARGSARNASALGLALICLLLCHFEIIESKDFIVGGASGWTFGVANWPNGKTFHAGDVLVFNYNPKAHSVVVVDAAGYNSCKPGPGSHTFNSGRDRITLKKGANYFICGFPNHCQMNMKIAVNAV